MKHKVLILALYLVFAATQVSAQLIPAAPAAGTAITLTKLETIIDEIATFLIIVSAIIVVIAIIWNGIKWAMAGDDSAKVQEAKSGLKAAIIGAFIIFGVGIIITTVVQILTVGSLR